MHRLYIVKRPQRLGKQATAKESMSKLYVVEETPDTVGERDYSAQETCHFLLQLLLKHESWSLRTRRWRKLHMRSHECNCGSFWCVTFMRLAGQTAEQDGSTIQIHAANELCPTFIVSVPCPPRHDASALLPRISQFPGFFLLT